MLPEIPDVPFGASDFGLLQRRHDRSHDLRCNRILQFENVFQATIDAICPDVAPGRSVDQLARYPYAITRLANATFKYVSNTQFTTDLANIR